MIGWESFAAQRGEGRLVLIGGGVQTTPSAPRPVLAEVAGSQAGRLASSVLLVPAASAQPERAVAPYVSAFRSMGVRQIQVLDVARRLDAVEPSARALALVRHAEVVFLTGGDQERLAALLRNSPLHTALSEALARGATIAGTSAGAVALTDVMHFGVENDGVQTAPGLGLLEQVFIDTHFTERQRLGRLFTLVTAEPGRIGLGLDEDTAIIVKATRLVVLGRGAVTIIDARPLLGDRRAGMHLHQLRSGNGYDLATGVPHFGERALRDYSLGGTAGRLSASSNR